MSDEGYAGRATLWAAEAEVTVEVRLSGRIEPVDGRYHWAGRIAPHEEVTRLVQAGARSATLSIAGSDPVQVRLSEVDPWGAVRVAAVAPAPWPRSGEVA